MTQTMLLLRGIAGEFDGKSYPNGALDEASATAYARLRGYEPKVLTVSGEAYDDSPQVQLAIKELRQDESITALLGFSGGAFNIRHIIEHAPASVLVRIRLLVVLGAPQNPASLYKGKWELVWRGDPPQGHMAGPAVLLAEWKAQHPVTS